MRWAMARGALGSPELGVSRLTYEPGVRMPSAATGRALDRRPWPSRAPRGEACRAAYGMKARGEHFEGQRYGRRAMLCALGGRHVALR